MHRQVKPVIHPKELYSETVVKSLWWQRILKWYKKNTGETIDRDDPEYNAQKIYQHWINSYTSK